MPNRSLIHTRVPDADEPRLLLSLPERVLGLAGVELSRASSRDDDAISATHSVPPVSSSSLLMLVMLARTEPFAADFEELPPCLCCKETGLQQGSISALQRRRGHSAYVWCSAWLVVYAPTAPAEGGRVCCSSSKHAQAIPTPPQLHRTGLFPHTHARYDSAHLWSLVALD